MGENLDCTVRRPRPLRTQCYVRQRYIVSGRTSIRCEAEGKVCVCIALEIGVAKVLAAPREDLPPKQRVQTYYGYSFESWCTSSRPGVPERLEDHPVGWGGDVDTNVQWCSVIKTKLGDNRLVIGGEVDCVRGWL